MFEAYVLKPTSLCNFKCTFCSARNIPIPLHEHVPPILKQYLIDHKVTNLTISGGEPLINPQSYFEDLISILEQIADGGKYEVGITSNMVLWDQNPEKYDYLFNNPNVIVETSFQYGGERQDDNDFTEERFLEIFNKFKNRYGYALGFIYVVNQNNEQYILKACELAKKLGTRFSISPQLPIGASTSFYPRYKLLDLYMKVIDAGYKDQITNLNRIKEQCCPFVNTSVKCRNYSKALYVDKNEQICEAICDPIISSSEPISDNELALFPKCYGCKLYNLCNSCLIVTHYSRDLKEKQCKWMKDNQQKLKDYHLLIEDNN